MGVFLFDSNLESAIVRNDVGTPTLAVFMEAAASAQLLQCLWCRSLNLAVRYHVYDYYIVPVFPVDIAFTHNFPFINLASDVTQRPCRRHNTFSLQTNFL